LPPAAQATDILTFAIVGGGFTGVEAAGEFTDFFRSIARFYRNLDPQEISIVLLEAGARLLLDLPPKMGDYSAGALGRRGVRILLNAPVAGADENGLSLKDGTRVESATIIWSAGVKPSPLVASLPIGTGRGGRRPMQSDRRNEVVGGARRHRPGRNRPWRHCHGSHQPQCGRSASSMRKLLITS